MPKHLSTSDLIEKRLHSMLGPDYKKMEPAARLNAVRIAIAWTKVQTAAKQPEYGAGFAALFAEDEAPPAGAT